MSHTGIYAHPDLLALEIRIRQEDRPHSQRLVRAVHALYWVRTYTARGQYDDAQRAIADARYECALYEAGV